jgi:hypothetical protein
VTESEADVAASASDHAGFFRPSKRAAAAAAQRDPVSPPRPRRDPPRAARARTPEIAPPDNDASASDEGDYAEYGGRRAPLSRAAPSPMHRIKEVGARRPRPRRATSSGMDEERAAVLIQAGLRGVIARRATEVQRCRLDLRAALAEAKMAPGGAHPEVTQSMLDLAEAYRRAWDRDSAEQAYSAALQAIERDYGVGDVRCRKPGDALARIYTERGDDAMAEEVMRRILAPPRGPPGVEEESAIASALTAVSSTLGACPRNGYRGPSARADASALFITPPQADGSQRWTEGHALNNGRGGLRRRCPEI